MKAAGISSNSHQTADGYRDPPIAEGSSLPGNPCCKTCQSNPQTYAFYGDLYYPYRVPDLSGHNANPKQSVRSGCNASADQAHAAICRKLLWPGLAIPTASVKLLAATNFYAAYTNYVNPTFRNYEFRSEPHFGGRTISTIQESRYT
jgi:iron complex outermembrane receptor protein